MPTPTSVKQHVWNRDQNAFRGPCGALWGRPEVILGRLGRLGPSRGPLVELSGPTWVILGGGRGREGGGSCGPLEALLGVVWDVPALPLGRLGALLNRLKA